MIHRREAEESFRYPDTDTVDPGHFYEIRYREIKQELYSPIDSEKLSYVRTCELIEDLDMIERRMIADQILIFDGRPKNNPQRLVDELFALSKMADPLKKPHHRKRK